MDSQSCNSFYETSNEMVWPHIQLALVLGEIYIKTGYYVGRMQINIGMKLTL